MEQGIFGYLMFEYKTLLAFGRVLYFIIELRCRRLRVEQRTILHNLLLLEVIHSNKGERQ